LKKLNKHCPLLVNNTLACSLLFEATKMEDDEQLNEEDELCPCSLLLFIN
jgi:hypothetical protein